MNGATMSGELPRRAGEDAPTYIRRLAVYLGYMSADAPEPGRAMPRAYVPYLQRLDAIFSSREPGEDAE